LPPLLHKNLNGTAEMTPITPSRQDILNARPVAPCTVVCVMLCVREISELGKSDAAAVSGS